MNRQLQTPVSGRPLRGLFVSGTGTDVGKTVALAALLRACVRAGVRVRPVKPVQTGVSGPDDARGDAAVYAAAVEGLRDAVAPATLRRFAMPASPHLAAGREGAHLDVDGLRAAVLRHWEGDEDAQGLLLEGAGGLHVPLNDTEDMLDLMEALGLPVLLVGGNYLGGLNHVLLSVEAVAARGLTLAGVILSDTRPPSGREEADARAIRQDNEALLRRRLAGRGARLIVLPFEPDLHSEPRASLAWQALAEACEPLVDVVRSACEPRAGEEAAARVRDLQERDRRSLWHPYTSATNPLPVFVMARSRRNRLALADGRELVDGMSSWWTAVHGYNHPRLTAALRRQAGRMPHVMFGGVTHEPAVLLAERLLELLPDGLERVFFADSGSVAVEVALKMALQYQQGVGAREKIRFLTPRGGYHGDTLGAMSVCDPVTGMHTLFNGILPRQIFVERPSCRFDAPFDPASLEDARRAFEEHGREIAAVILEPVVQGAGGMWFYHPDYLRGLAELCRAHGALLIFDEIATGFGRTGRMFALEHAGVTPDILCCGKALTGGVMTLAAAVCSQRVAEGICRDGQVFMHGPTFMGNPLACSVALASLELLADGAWRRQVAALESSLRTGLSPCAGMPGVADVRVLGGIGVVETEQPVDMAALQDFFVQRGVWIRPFNRLIYLMPPYISPAEDIARLCDAVRAAVMEGRLS